MSGAPDLLIKVTYQSNSLSFELKAADPELNLNYRPYAGHPFRRDPESFFHDFFEKLDHQSRQIGISRDQEELKRLHKMGLYLYETVFPKDLQDMLWRIRPFVRTLHVLSDEPWIPWEICKFQSHVDGKTEEGPFFCEHFKMTRWCAGGSPAQTLAMNNMAVVGLGGRKLPHVRTEIDQILDLQGPDRKVTEVEATLRDLENAMNKGSYNAWHFAGHGDKPQGAAESSLTLKRGDLLEPSTISGLSKNMGRPHPLIFFNSCWSGRGQFSLTGLGGWAGKFMDIGAGAFIGTQWPVQDGSALKFSESFYSYFLKGLPLAEAVNKARLDIKDSGDSSWLAYVVFGDFSALAQGRSLNKEALKWMGSAKASMGSYLSRHGLDSHELAGILTEKSGDNATYIKHVVRELTEGMYQGKAPQRLPSGLNAYYGDFLKHLREFRDADELEDHYKVLGVLCSAQEALPIAALTVFSELDDPEQTHRVIKFWRPFLVKDPHYALEEPLRLFLKNESYIDVIQAHRHIAHIIRSAFDADT